MSTFQDMLHNRQEIKIDVDYYDDRQAELLSKYTNAEGICKCVGRTISIPVAEFLTYCLFVNKREQDDRLSTYCAIKKGLNDWLGDFNNGLVLTANSLRTKFTGNDQLCGLSEKIGVGVSLSVISQIHGLKEADWERIHVGKKKSLDFKRACGSTGYVQVECKGTSVADNQVTGTSGLRSFASHIAEKKEELRSQQPNVTAYGTIGAIDTREDSVLKCWLLDPSGEAGDRDPKEQRILNRLFFIAELMETILPQSPTTVALYKRLVMLVSSDDLYDYNRVPLPVHLANIDNTPLFRKARSPDNGSFGVTIKLNDGSRFYYGMRQELVKLAVEQDFDQVLAMQWTPSTVSDSIVVPDGAESTDDDSTRSSGTRAKRKERPVFTNIHTTSSGRVFALLGKDTGEPLSRGQLLVE